MKRSVWPAVTALGLTLAASAGAAPLKRPPKAPVVDLKVVAAKLKSNDPARMVEALALVQTAGPAAGAQAPAIEEILRRGATAGVTKAALDALGAIGAPSSSGVVRAYVQHRSPDLRRAAIRALGQTKGPEAVAAFKDGLRSADAQVRGYSATGLGNLGGEAAVPELFVALDHEVLEAAAAIGQVCQPADCERFAGKLGHLGFDVMTSGFDPILFRAHALPDAALVKLVSQLRELGTSDAGKYLVDVQSRWPKGGSPKVKAAIDQAVQSLPVRRGP